MNRNFDSNLIDAYLDGNLSAAAKADFEAQMAADPALADQVDLFRLEAKATSLLVQEAYREKFKQWRQQGENQAVPPPPAATGNRKKGWFLLAAALAAGAALLYFAATRLQNHASTTGTPAAPDTLQRQENLPVSPPAADSAALQNLPPVANSSEEPKQQTAPPKAQGQSQIAQNFFIGTVEKELVRNSTRLSDLSADTSLFFKADRAFQQGKFSQATSFLTTLQQQRTLTWQEKQLFAFSLFRSGNFAKAENFARQLAHANEPQYPDQGEWLLALCRLARFGKTDAELGALFKKMEGDGKEHSYFDAAVELKKELAK